MFLNSARWWIRFSTPWSWSASAASPSNPRLCACSTRRWDGETYTLNLIDTPGHVDFSYEVSRALAACEGALLVVDATQGIEAQTLANVYMALEHDLETIPVINKIDLPSAQPEEVKKEIEDVIGLDASRRRWSRPRRVKTAGTCWRRSSNTSPRPRR